MSDWAELFVSPHLIDVILVMTVLEAVVLLRVRRRSQADPSADRDGNVIGGGGISPVEVVLLLLPGLCLMLALRAALAGAAWPWVPATLAVALVAHLADVWKRWFS